MNYLLTRGLVLILLVLATAPAMAQRGPGRGFGRGPGGPGHRQDDRFQEDRELFQFLLKNHERITRSVKQLGNGVETLTESEDENIAAKIKEHVEWMQYRIDETKPIRLRDPLYAELFKHTDKIKMAIEETANGVRVTETSDDPYVARLIKAHAKTVSGFVKHGFAEAMKNHAVPGRSNREQASFNPLIKKYGEVVKLTSAVQQPRNNSKICVSLTGGSEPGELNPAIEKVARFVNIYAGAGKKPAKVNIAVVIHGDTTLAILNSDAYSERFGIDGNPNLDCLHELHEAGVELFVCGQSLVNKGGKQEEVVVFVDVAVSAATAVVNLQADGYAYLPIGK